MIGLHPESLIRPAMPADCRVFKNKLSVDELLQWIFPRCLDLEYVNTIPCLISAKIVMCSSCFASHILGLEVSKKVWSWVGDAVDKIVVISPVGESVVGWKVVGSLVDSLANPDRKVAATVPKNTSLGAKSMVRDRFDAIRCWKNISWLPKMGSNYE